MAGNNIKVNLQFNADTSSAKKAIADLQASFKNLEKVQIGQNFSNEAINKAVESAKQLEQHLQAATNASTGKLNLTEFNNSLLKAGTSLGELSQNLLRAGSTGQQAFTALTAQIAQAEVPLRKMNSTLANFGQTLKNTVKWEISSTMIHGVESALSGAISYAQNLNAALNDIRIVTGQSIDQVSQFAQTANRMAQQLSTTTTNYSKAALIFYQQGLNDKQVTERTNTVMKMANVTKDSMTDVSSYMTAIWNNFDDGTTSLEHFADVITALGASTASSSKEIAAGLSQFSSIGKTIGLSYEYATSALATVVAKTRQSADTVGTGFRTIFSRLQSLKLGETLEDGVGLTKYSKALQTVGVDVLDLNGGLKDADVILSELASKWGTLTKAQKTALAQTVGGVRQYTTLISLMDNWGDVEKNLKIAQNSDGSLQKQQDIYAQSWEAASKRQKATLEQLYSNILDDKAFIKMTDGITSIIGAVDKLISAFGGLPGVIASVGSILTSVFSDKITNKISSIGKNIGTYFGQFKGQGFGKSAISIFTGKAQNVEQVRAGQAVRKDIADLENAKANSVLTQNQINTVNNSIELLKQKEQLIAQQHLMSQERQAAAQQSISNLAMINQRKAELNTQQDESDNKYRESVDKAQREAINNATNFRFRDQNDGKWQTNSMSDRIAATNGLLSNVLANPNNSNIFNKINTDNGKITTDSLFQQARDNWKKYQGLTSIGVLDSSTTKDQLNALKEKIHDTLGVTIKATTFDSFNEEVKQARQECQSLDQQLEDLIDETGNVISGSRGEQAGRNFVNGMKDGMKAAREAGANDAKIKGESGYLDQERNKEKGKLAEIFKLDKDKLDKFASGAATATKAISGFTAGMAQGASLAKAFGDANASASDKIMAVGVAALNIGSKLASGDWIGAATAAIGTAVSYLLEQKKMIAENVENERLKTFEKTKESIQNNGEQIDSIRSLTQEFNSLYNIKNRTAEEDNKLSSVAQSLADAYGITGTAVQNLTGDYSELQKVLAQIAAGEWEPEVKQTAEDNVKAAESAVQAASLKFVNESNWRNYTRGISVDEVDKNELRAAQAAGYASSRPIENYTLGTEVPLLVYGEDHKLTTSMISTYEMKGGKSANKLKDSNGNKVRFNNNTTEMSFDELMEQYNASQYFIHDNGYAELLVGDRSSFNYIYGMYQALSEMEKAMSDAGLDDNNGYLKSIRTVLSHLKDPIDAYEASIDNYSNELANEVSGIFIGKEAGENYKFSDFWADFKVGREKFENDSRVVASFAQKTEEEQQESVFNFMKSMTGIHSGLDDYTSLLYAAYEIFDNNLENAGTALQMFENRGYDLKYIDAASLQYFKKYGFSDGRLDTRLALNKQQQAYNTSIQGQEAMSQIGGLLKKDMSFADTEALYNAYDAISKDGQVDIMAWDDFITMSYEEKSAYLEAQGELYIQTTEEAAQKTLQAAQVEKQAADAALESFKNNESKWSLYGTATEYITAMQNAAEKLEQKEDGSWGLKEGMSYSDGMERAWGSMFLQRGEEDAAANPLEYMQKMWEGLPGFKELKDIYDEYSLLYNMSSSAEFAENNAERNLNIWKAMSSSVGSVVDQVNRLKNSLENLPSSMSEVEKIVKTLNGNGIEDVNKETLLASTVEQRADWYLQAAQNMLNGPAPTDPTNAEAWATYQENQTNGRDLMQTALSFKDKSISRDLNNYKLQIEQLTSAYETFYSTGKMTNQQKDALTMLGIDPNNLKTVKDFYKEIEKIKQKYQERAQDKKNLLSAFGIEIEDLNILDTFDDFWEQLDQSSKERLKNQKDSIREWYDAWREAEMGAANVDRDFSEQITRSAEDRNKKIYENKKEELNKEKDAADRALSLISNVGTGDIDLTNLYELKQALIDAGVAAERADDLIQNIGKSRTKSDQARAAAEAAGEALLAKTDAIFKELGDYNIFEKNSIEELAIDFFSGKQGVGAQKTTEREQPQPQKESYEEQKEKKGKEEEIVVKIDSGEAESKIEELTRPRVLNISVQLEEPEEIEDQEVNITFTGNLEEIQDQITDLHVDDKHVSFVIDGKDEIENLDKFVAEPKQGIITYKTNLGTVTADLDIVTIDKNGKIVFESDLGEVTQDLASIEFTEAKVTFTSTDGIKITTSVEESIQNANRSVIISPDPKSLAFTQGKINKIIKDVNGEITVDITQEDGTTLTAKVTELVKEADGSVKVTMDQNGSTITANVNSELGKMLGRVKVTPSVTNDAPLIIQRKIDSESYTATVSLKINSNLGKQAVDRIASDLMKSLNPKQLNEYLEMLQKAPSELAEVWKSDANKKGFLTTKGWDDSQKAAIAGTVSNIMSLDAASLQTMIVDGTLEDIVEVLQAGIESKNAATQTLASNLLQGLALGIRDADIDWSACIGAVGNDIIKAFKNALGIHSPSERTKELAPYLFDGLIEGISKASPKVKQIQLGGLTNVIVQSFRAALDQAKTEIENGNQEFYGGIFNDTIELMKEFDNAEGETIEERAMFLAKEKYDTAEEAIRFGQEEEENYYKDKGYYFDEVEKNWFKDTTNGKERITGNILKVGNQINQKAIDNYYGGIVSQLTNGLYSSYSDFVTDYIKNQRYEEEGSGFSSAQQVLFKNAVDYVTNNSSKWANLDEALQTNNIDEFIQEVQDKLQNDIDTILVPLDASYADFMNTINGVFSSVTTEAEEEAKKTIEVWENAFKAIAKARQGLAEGKTIMETMFGDVDELARVVNSYITANGSLEGINAYLNDRNAQVDFTPYDREAYHNSGNQRFLNRDAYGNYIDTTIREFEQHVSEFFDTGTRDQLFTRLNSIYSPEYLKALHEGADGGNNAAQAMRQWGLNNKLFKISDDGLTLMLNNEIMDENVDISFLREQFIKKVMEGFTSQADIDNLLSRAFATQTSEGWKLGAQAEEIETSRLNKQQGQLDTLNKTRTLLASGQSLANNLTVEEQRSLLELTGQTDLAAVSLSQVDSACQTLAQTMQATATEISQAIQMMREGKIDNYQVDSEGHVTGQKTYNLATASEEELNFVREHAGAEYAMALAEARIAAINAGYAGEDIDQITDASQIEDETAKQAFIAALNGRPVTIDIVISGAGAEGLNSTITNGTDAVNIEDAAIIQGYADAAGMTVSAFEEYVRLSDDLIISNGELFDQYGNLTTAAARWAAQLKRCQDGQEELIQSGKEWLKVAKDQTRRDGERAAAIDKLKQSYGKVLGLNEEQSKNLSNSFIYDAKNLKLVEKASKDAGQEGAKAIDQLQANAVKATFSMANLSEETQGLIDILSKGFDTGTGHTLQAGDVIDEGSFQSTFTNLNGLWHSLMDAAADGSQSFDSACKMVGDSMTALGYIPSPFTVDTETITLDDALLTSEDAGTDWYSVPNPSGEPTVYNIRKIRELVETGQLTRGQQIQVIRGKNGAPTSYTKGAEGPRGGGGGSRGGGGGGQREARRASHSTIKPERYRRVNTQIADKKNEMDRQNKKTERAYGKERLDSLNKESSILKDQISLTKQKIKEAKEWAIKDKEEAIKVGFKFDANGVVTNYEAVIEKGKAEYNKFIDQYNAMGADAQEDLDKRYADMKDKDGVFYSSYEDYLKKTYLDPLEETLKQWEETRQLIEELAAEYDEQVNQMYDKVLEKIQYTLDTKIDVNSSVLDVLEYKLEKIADNGYRAAETLALIGDKIALSENSLGAYTEALDALLRGHNGEWSAEKLMTGQISPEELLKGGLDAKDMELMNTIIDGLRESISTMSEEITSAYETTNNAFSQFTEDMGKYSEIIEHCKNVTQTYRNILDLTGKSANGMTVAITKTLNEYGVAQAQHKMEMNKTRLETTQRMLEAQQEIYDDAIAKGLPESALKAAKEGLETAEEAYRTAEEEYLSSWEETLQAAADAFQNTMEAVTRSIGDSMVNNLAGGLAQFEDQFSKLKEQDEDYVDDYEKIYQLTKLSREIQTKADSTENVSAQKKLLGYRQEVNRILQSDQKLSEYDIDYMRKKYDLLAAMIALQETQDAKSQVTMRRDSEGNYNYVYTANDGAVAKAEDEYATKLYEMQKANDEYITNLSDTMSSLSSQMLEEIASIDTTIYDTEEKYQEEVARISDHYMVQMDYYNSEMQKVIDNNKELYEEDWIEFNRMTGYKISAAENYVDSFEETVLSQASGFKTLEEYTQAFNMALHGGDPNHPSADSLIGQSIASYITMKNEIDKTNGTAGTSTLGLADMILGGVAEVTTGTQQAATDVEAAATRISTAVEQIETPIQNLAESWHKNMSKMIRDTEYMIDCLLQMMLLQTEGMTADVALRELAKYQKMRENNPYYQQGTVPNVEMATGGYTGEWGDSSGRLAVLHQKEIVLNADDTVNLLSAVDIIRDISNAIDLNALTAANGLNNLFAATISPADQILQQEVHIEASFPNATDKNEIEDAFKDLVNLASQYAGR